MKTVPESATNVVPAAAVPRPKPVHHHLQSRPSELINKLSGLLDKPSGLDAQSVLDTSLLKHLFSTTSMHGYLACINGWCGECLSPGASAQPRRAAVGAADGVLRGGGSARA